MPFHDASGFPTTALPYNARFRRADGRTAIRAGLVIWALVYLWPSIPLMASMLSVGLVMLALGWGLSEVLIASIAGAYEYQQGPIS